LALLDRETRSFHAEADRGWHQLLRGGETSRADYARQLIVTYGFESPFEAACSRIPGVGQIIDLRGRWRSGLIAQDLLAMGCASDDVTNMPCASLAPFQEAAEALAWMYVVQRPSLIHADIGEKLTSRFVDLVRATSYLAAYDGTESKRWAELGIALDQLCVSERVCERVIGSACTAFRTLVEWQGAGQSARHRAG
jgi:heme oxygenase